MEINNRILIVDDNAAIHDDFRKILCPMRTVEVADEYTYLEQSLFEEQIIDLSTVNALNIQYDMDFAFQGEEALEKVLTAEAEGAPYAIVYTDVRMPPGFDGIQLVSQLLEQAPHTEIVIVTAYSDYTWEEMTERFGWTDRLLFLRKPFDVITVRQLALTLTKKWSLGAQARSLAKAMELNLNHLEKRVEERTAKLAQANKDLQNFAYIVSHDLSSPLLSIQGFTGELNHSINDIKTALGETIGELPEERRVLLETAIDDHIPEAMDFIKTSVNKMDSLIKAILKLSRLGYRKFHFEKVNMQELVDQNLKALAYTIEKSDIHVEVGKLPELMADRLTMEQVFGNLLSNAVKFSSQERKSHIRVYAEESESGATFHIQDNGIGIPVQDMPTVFDIFQRCGGHNIPGEGMGLAFVKTLISQLGGKIWCQSEQSIGSTFSFFLPNPTEEMTSAAETAE